MFTSNLESMPGIDVVIATLKTIPTIMKTSPNNKHFFAFFGSSQRKKRYATMPPIMPNNTGSKNHMLLLGFSGNVINYHSYFAVIAFFL